MPAVIWLVIMVATYRKHTKQDPPNWGKTANFLFDGTMNRRLGLSCRYDGANLRRVS